MSRWTIVLAAVLMCTLVAMGCSSGGGTPVTPTTDNLTGQTTTHGTQTNLWGLFDVYIDIQAQKAEAVMNRSCMFTANVVTFLNNPATNMGFNIIGTPVDPAFIDVDIDVSLTHPFPGLTQYNGYDVRGVFIGDASGSLAYNSALTYAQYGVTDQVMYDYNLTEADIHVGLVGMPDGYTRWWNPTEFTTTMDVLGYTQGKLGTPAPYTPTGTLNPYKYFADGLGAEDDLWAWLNVTENADMHGVFSAGTTNTRNYYLRFPMDTPGVKYEYAVVANWEGEGAEFHPSNAPEAIAVTTNIVPDIYFVDGTDNGGNFIADISVYNWSVVMQESCGVWVESDVLSAPYQLNAGEMTPTGGGDHFSTYHVEIAADNVTKLDGNQYWIIVEQPGKTYGNDFGVTNLAQDDTLAAFFRYDLYVSPTSYCPDVTITGVDLGGGATSTDYIPVIGIVITGTGFEGPTSVVKFINGSYEVVATNVVVNDETNLTCDADFTGAPAGYYDLYVQNDCGNEATVVDAINTWFGIRVDDTSPLGAGVKDLPTPPSTMTEAIDLAVSPSDGDVYVAWAQPPHGYSDIGYVDRYDPTATTTLMSAICWQAPQYDEIIFQRDNVEVDVGYAGGVEGWGCVTGNIHYGSNDTNTAGTNDSYAFWGYGYGPNAKGFAASNASEGYVYTYNTANSYGSFYRCYWRHGNASGNWDQLQGYYEGEVNIVYLGGGDFDGTFADKLKGTAMNVRNTTNWSLTTDTPHLKRYTNWQNTSYATTGNFGDDGTGDGEIMNPVDVSIRFTGDRLYVLDAPEAGKFRIQCFGVDGSFKATSGALNTSDFGGGDPYSIEYNLYNDFIYVLFNNNKIRAFNDFTK